MMKNERANKTFLEKSLCNKESYCIGSAEVIGDIEGVWQTKELCIINAFTNTIKFKPIDCVNQEQLQEHMK